MDEFKQRILQRLSDVEDRVALLERNQELVANSARRAAMRRFWLRPPMWTFEQHPPRPLALRNFPSAPPPPADAPRIVMVTPSYNHGRYLSATIDGILAQNYPGLHYHVQDGASLDGTIDILKSHGNSLSWCSEPDSGQSQAINRGFADTDGDIMAYLNSDDTLLPGTLAYVANYFLARPHVASGRTDRREFPLRAGLGFPPAGAGKGLQIRPLAAVSGLLSHPRPAKDGRDLCGGRQRDARLAPALAWLLAAADADPACDRFLCPAADRLSLEL